ncbi:MAG: dihydrodipicolinate synthase family protein [Candidatus Thermoplasmatota archaeon]|jgi:dihydrodipicolinate synthase/N-acetylneuraminate lyase|nr:dihydrodipicolinate synthase family protein [Candidatus Thermoplasmatota archaeon]
MAKLVIPCVTPFRNGVFDLKSFRKLMKYASDNDFDGVFVLGSTGGFAALDFRLHRKIIKLVADEIPDKMEKYAGISRSDLPETLELAREAEKAGFQRMVAINPFYHRYSEASLVRFFSRIASSIRGDLYLYNNPALSGHSLSAKLVEKMMKQYDTIKGIKDSSGNLEHFRELLGIRGLEVFQGKDSLLADSLKLGATGGVCSSSNFCLNTLNIAKGRSEGYTSSMKLSKLMDIISRYDIPSVHNYLFRRLLLGEKEPSNYMPEPFLDLQNPPEPEEISEYLELPAMK